MDAKKKKTIVILLVTVGVVGVAGYLMYSPVKEWIKNRKK
jgi:flagellar basal body-associated protein FliL